MTSQMFAKGKQLFTHDTGRWNQGQTGDIGVKGILVDLNDCGPNSGSYVITGVTNVADPVITTSAAHGLAVGDRVSIHGLVGSTGLNNGATIPYWVVSSTPLTTTFTVDDPDGANPGSPGAYTSGGFIMNLSKQFLSEVAGVAGAIISRTGLWTGKTSTNGVFDADNPTFPSVTAGADAAEAVIVVMARALHGDASDLADSAERLIYYVHEGTGLPYSGQGNNVDFLIPTQGLFEI